MARHDDERRAHYLHSPEPGPVLIETEVVRGGRSTSQLRARMEQDSKRCVGSGQGSALVLENADASS